MTTTTTTTNRSSNQGPSLVAALLSYLVPGLGQIYQGRTSKGVLFLVSLYGLFFYGMWLGNWCNVYVYWDAQDQHRGPKRFLERSTEKARVYGQVGIGVAAWPALWHFYKETSWKQDMSPEEWAEIPFLKRFQTVPPEKVLNKMQADGDKFWDLGLIYTIIAGVLNILVIYDAFAGPVFIAETEAQTEPRKEASVA